MMKTKIIYIMLIIPVIAWGQDERKYIRDGYKAYMDENYNEAEVDFRKAEEAKNDSYIARYNTSAALYQQDKLEESGKRFSELLQETGDPGEQAKLLHNIGNVMMDGKKYEQAVEAYKRSLKLNPKDEDTRYNLAYALEKLREQQKQQQQQQQQNQDKQNNKDQKDQDKQKQDQQDQQQQDQDQQKKDQQEQQQQEQQDQQQANENKDQQQQPQQLSKEEAERLLNAILQKEKDVKKEVDKKKAKVAKIKTDKDW